MTPMDHHLSRLLKAAAAAPAEPPLPLSSASEARLLAAWRVARNEPSFIWLPLFHRGLAFAAAVMILSAAVGLRELSQDVPDELNTSNALVNLVVLR